MHDLVQGGRQGHFGGRDRGLTGVCGLEDPGVHHDFFWSGGCVRTEANHQGLVAGQRPRKSRYGGRHTLVAGDHGLDDPLFGGQDFGEDGVVARRIANHCLIAFRVPQDRL